MVRDGNESARRRARLTILVSLSLSFSLIPSSFSPSLYLSFPSSPLPAAFSSFHTPLSQFSSPTGREPYDRPPPPGGGFCRLCVLSRKQRKRLPLSIKRKDISSTFHEDTKNRRSDNSRRSHSRVYPSVNVAVGFLPSPPAPFSPPRRSRRIPP